MRPVYLDSSTYEQLIDAILAPAPETQSDKRSHVMEVLGEIANIWPEDVRDTEEAAKEAFVDALDRYFFVKTPATLEALVATCKAVQAYHEQMPIKARASARDVLGKSEDFAELTFAQGATLVLAHISGDEDLAA